jgi:hypothetical protein
MAWIVACTAVTAVLFLAADVWGRAALTPLVMLLWFVLAFLVSWPLLNLASRAITLRRENLALLSK